MAMENRLFSLGLLKPDCVAHGLTARILRLVLAKGLKIVAVRTVRMTDQDVRVFYDKIHDEDFFPGLSAFLQSGVSIAYIVYGEDAMGVLNELVGATDPKDAAPNTIRSMGEDIRHNLAHSSENRYDFLREAGVIWSNKELEEMGAK